MRPSIRMPLLFAGLVAGSLLACTEGDRALHGCPLGEVCSDTTPQGLHFLGPRLAGGLALPPLDTAIGGTQDIELAEKLGDTFVPLADPYTATTETDQMGVAGTEGATVTITGVAPGFAYLRIDDLDGLLMDRKRFATAAITSMSIVPEQIEATDLPVAFLAGTIRFGVALEGVWPGGDGTSPTRLVDQSMTLELAGATRIGWDTLEVADAQPGTLGVMVTAGDLPPAPLDVEVVDGVDELIDHPDDLVAGQLGVVCFDARSGTHHVAGLTWAFTGDNGQHGRLFATNCDIVAPDHAGTITITATANNLVKTVTYPVAEAPAKPARATGRAGTTATTRPPEWASRQTEPDTAGMRARLAGFAQPGPLARPGRLAAGVAVTVGR